MNLGSAAEIAARLTNAAFRDVRDGRGRCRYCVLSVPKHLRGHVGRGGVTRSEGAQRRPRGLRVLQARRQEPCDIDLAVAVEAKLASR